jgi:hypothetical protein
MYRKIIAWREDEVAKLYRRMKGLVTVIFKKDCLDLPDKLYERIQLQLTEQATRWVKIIKKQARNSLELCNQLQQLSDGFQYQYEANEKTGKMDRSTLTLATPKDDALLSLIEEYSDNSSPRMVVLCAYLESVRKVTEMFSRLGWQVLQISGKGYIPVNTSRSKDELLTEMDRSTCSSDSKICVVAQTDSASAGLEFSASPCIVYYSNSNNGANRMQSEDRAYSNNMDKSRGLTIYDFLYLPTDKLILDSLKLKKDLQNLSMGDLLACLD